jgi:NAD(P)-dependent dehydrogenase (short-subunit alcohol dehydrogenase family)
MRARRSGLIVNVTSMAGIVPAAGVGAYGGSKLALESISDALAQEVDPFGIGVMIVIPGAFRTDLGRNRHSIADSIPDYAPQNAARRERLAALSGHQRGDPRKAAQVILSAIDATPRPRRLLLGPDAAAHIGDFLSRYRDEIERWRPISSATDLAVQ